MLDWHIRKLIIADDDEEEVLTLHDDAAHAEAQNRPSLRDRFLNEERASSSRELFERTTKKSLQRMKL